MGPSPVDRGRAGSKRRLITDGYGTPLAVPLTGGNRNDVTQLLPLLDAVPPIRGRVGRPRRRAVTLYADRGYDHDSYRKVRARSVVPVIARHGTEHGPGLGVYRWVRSAGRAAWRSRRRRARRRVRPRCAGGPAGSIVLRACRQYCLRHHSMQRTIAFALSVIAPISLHSPGQITFDRLTEF
jgi:hypothetical protein